uniref:Uncharacterized protein n=1 Tax=Gopherus evgoodei TaxID=1825980 RepID=A0A8C4Y6I7_9SAUR
MVPSGLKICESLNSPSYSLSVVGHVPFGLICHPDREHFIYPLGCTIIIQGLNNNTQAFLHGHTNNVSCVAVSRSGCYVASGQVTFMGFKGSFAGIICCCSYTKSCLLGCHFTRGKLKNWRSLQMNFTWCHWEARMMAGNRIKFESLSSPIREVT